MSLALSIEGRARRGEDQHRMPASEPIGSFDGFPKEAREGSGNVC